MTQQISSSLKQCDNYWVKSSILSDLGRYSNSSQRYAMWVSTMHRCYFICTDKEFIFKPIEEANPKTKKKYILHNRKGHEEIQAKWKLTSNVHTLQYIVFTQPIKRNAISFGKYLLISQFIRSAWCVRQWLLWHHQYFSI